jgi:hypothetical protein
MPQNFIECDREQELLLPPNMRDWLPEDHLAWFVLDAVEELDLQAFYDAYRQDGWGRAAFEPKVMMALLLYAYAVGERSSRGIERRCREDVASASLLPTRSPTTPQSPASVPAAGKPSPTPSSKSWRSAQGPASSRSGWWPLTAA